MSSKAERRISCCPPCDFQRSQSQPTLLVSGAFLFDHVRRRPVAGSMRSFASLRMTRRTQDDKKDWDEHEGIGMTVTDSGERKTWDNKIWDDSEATKARSS